MALRRYTETARTSYLEGKKLNPTTQKQLNKYAELALCKLPTIYNTYQLAAECKDIGGDFVECGVFAGSQLAAMRLADPRAIHAFDSFEGIPAAGIEDGNDGKLIEFKSVCSLEQVKEYMDMWGIEGIVYHKGWFKDTVPQYEGKIALLRLDGDLYSSTKMCLEHLYPKLVKGGYLIIDDYALNGCRQAVDEYLPDAVFTKVKDGGGPVWLKRS
jgi:hypothetical protein